MAIRVLFVDDEPALRMLVETQLRDEGIDVTTADDGDTALDILDKEKFDLILLDIRMPRMDGVSVLKEIGERRISSRVIMLTAVEDFEVAIEAVKLGAIDYITKPYQLEELTARIRRVVAK